MNFRVYELYYDKDNDESAFFQAVSLLFMSFLYVNKINGVKLHIPINDEKAQKNDILNLNPILNKLTGIVNESVSRYSLLILRI